MVTKQNTPCVWLKRQVDARGCLGVEGPPGGSAGRDAQAGPGDDVAEAPWGCLTVGGVRGPASREARKPDPHTLFTFQRAEEEARGGGSYSKDTGVTFGRS